MAQDDKRLVWGILAASGTLGVLAATWMGLGALRGRGAMACWAVILLYLLLTGLLLIRRPLFRKADKQVGALVGLYLCLCLRLTLFDYISPDYVSFLGPWTEQMRGMTVRQVLTTPIGDYNMPYLYLLLLISRLPMYDLYLIKLVSVLADVFLALAAGRMTRMFTRKDWPVMGAFLGTLLAPTVLFNSAYWGQCDGVYACLAIWGLYWGIKKRPVLSVSLFSLAFSFKLQAVFLLPMLLFLLAGKRMRLRHLWAFPGVFLLVVLPALLAGRRFSDTFGIYLSQTDAYPYLSLNAPSFWSLIPNDFFKYLGTGAVLMAGIVTLIMLWRLLPMSDRFSKGDLLNIALLFSLAIPWLLPRMHERYFYLAEALSVLCAARDIKKLPVAGIILTGGFLAYCSYLFGGMRILSNELVAGIYGLLLAYMVWDLFRRLPGGSPKHPLKEEQSNEQDQRRISLE